VLKDAVKSFVLSLMGRDS